MSITYADVLDGIYFMANSNNESWSLDETTTRNAVNYLGFLESIGAKVPQIYSHGEDALVFTWKNPDYSLTVSHDFESYLSNHEYLFNKNINPKET